MRYIGSKRLLLREIEKVIEENIGGKSHIFCDIFSGTGSVSEYFKKDYAIISNDLLFFSYSLLRASIMENSVPKFELLSGFLGQNPIDFLNNKKVDFSDLTEVPFIYNNYSPNNSCDRMYLTNENALKIDYIRQSIEKWKRDEMIQNNEYYYILASLIHAIPFYSNIAGTYGAYLKHWDNRSLKEIKLQHLEITNNHKDNIVYNENANSLIGNISGDILYIDPPYNTRQYLPNYHLLETIAKYDSPEIYGKTGMRPYKHVRSKYCIKKDVLNEFDNLIKTAKFRHIIVSYSTEGIMQTGEIQEILEKYGRSNTFKLYRILYRRYKHTKSERENNLEELLFYIEKE